MAPVLWDAVRFEVDKRGEPGQFILTGSVSHVDNVDKNPESVRLLLRSLALKNRIDKDKMGVPSFLMIITGGQYAYRRSDGVWVVPLACLKD